MIPVLCLAPMIPLRDGIRKLALYRNGCLIDFTRRSAICCWLRKICAIIEFSLLVVWFDPELLLSFRSELGLLLKVRPPRAGCPSIDNSPDISTTGTWLISTPKLASLAAKIYCSTHLHSSSRSKVMLMLLSTAPDRDLQAVITAFNIVEGETNEDASPASAPRI